MFVTAGTLPAMYVNVLFYALIALARFFAANLGSFAVASVKGILLFGTPAFVTFSLTFQFVDAVAAFVALSMLLAIRSQAFPS